MTLKPHQGSWLDFLSKFEPNERYYLEVAFDDYRKTMSMIQSSLTRRPIAMQCMRFSTSLLTAVSASKAGDVRYLICIERTT